MNTPGRDPAPGGHASRVALGALAAGVAGGLAAHALGPLALPAAGAMLAAAAAAVAPAVVALLLLVTVIVQDWVVDTALPAFQQADEVLLAVGLAGLALRALARGRLARTPLDVPIVAFGAVAALSAVVNGVPAWIAALGLLAVWKGPLAYALFARVRITGAAVERAARLLLGLVAALAALGVAQRLGGAAVFQLTGRLTYYLEWQGTKAPSLFTNHNAFGHACVLGGLLAVGLALTTAEGRRRAVVLAGLACLAGLVVSASRESWLAAAAALAVGAAVTRSRRLLALSFVVCLALAAGALVVYVGSPFLKEELVRRGAGVFDGWRNYRLGFDDWAYRGEYRVYVLLKSWQVFLDQPLLGVGPGRFGGQVAFVHGSAVYERYAFLPLRGEYHPLDVFWSRLVTEFGLAGAAAYLWAWLRAGLGLARAAAHPVAVTRGLALGGVMAWAAAAVLALFAPALEDPLVALPVWAWAGAVLVLSRSAEGDRAGSGT